MQNADFGKVKIHIGKYGAIPQAVMESLFSLMLRRWDASWHCVWQGFRAPVYMVTSLN